MIDSLKYSNELKKYDFNHNQAEGAARVMSELVDDNLLTKSDFKDIDHKLSKLELNLTHKIHQIESRLMIKLGTMISLGVVVLAGLIKFL